MGPERLFRVGRVDPFLKALKNTYSMSVQQKSIGGSPDKLLCVCGQFVAVELKSDKGRLAPLQKWTGEQITKAGGLYLVVSPSNWEETKNLLIRLDQGESFV